MTTKRFAHIQKLIEVRRDIHSFPDSADRILFNAIVQALPPVYHEVYDWMVQGIYGGTVTTAMVMKAWDWNPNMASTVLNELWQFGLLERVEKRDESGRRFVYKVKE